MLCLEKVADKLKRADWSRFMTCLQRLLLAAMLGLLPDLALAERLDLQKDGINLSVDTLSDRTVFCFSASNDFRVSSEYGIEFRAVGQSAKFWRDHLPKVVTGPPRYFKLPLRVELRTRGTRQARRRIFARRGCGRSRGTGSDRKALPAAAPREASLPDAGTGRRAAPQVSRLRA